MGVIGPIGPIGPIGSDRRWCALLTQRGEHPEVGATDHNPVQRSCAGMGVSLVCVPKVRSCGAVVVARGVPLARLLSISRRKPGTTTLYRVMIRVAALRHCDASAAHKIQCFFCKLAI